MSRARVFVVLTWLGTLLVVTGLGGLAVRAADLGSLATVALTVAVLVVGLLCAGAVLVALRPRLLAACASEDPGGCGACGKSCLKAGASTG